MVTISDDGQIVETLGTWKLPFEPPKDLNRKLKCIYEKDKYDEEAREHDLRTMCNLGYWQDVQTFCNVAFGPSLGKRCIINGLVCVGRALLFE